MFMRHRFSARDNLAEWYGRIGQTDQAFQYFDIMKAIYMSDFHPKLLYATYSVDRCAVSFATASLWYLQRGDIDKAIDQCDYVIKEILPVYNKKDDMIGLYHILIALIRVLKWNGRVDKAREVYTTNTPEGIEKHFAVGHVHEPMNLLLRICDGSSEEYSRVEPSDIELALEFTPSDMTDNNMTCDGWSTCHYLQKYVFILHEDCRLEMLKGSVLSKEVFISLQLQINESPHQME